jgi:hypothetical protein
MEEKGRTIYDWRLGEGFAGETIAIIIKPVDIANAL